ncbi:ALBINO3-like protein 2, chloroplastic isoform X1 [Coffea arabica]|uniref:ALBINO3-like protein 2, chloroplastic isoform X1 n=1 Tax=Coffea arabica TaxID=13443 RepID=A0ABM4VS38_COFAR
MATPKISTLSNLLRRSRRSLSNSSFYFSIKPHHHPNHRHFLHQKIPAAAPSNPPLRYLTAYNFLLSRSFSTSESTGQFDGDSDLTQSELFSAISTAGAGEIGADSVAEESILPVRALIWFLDGYHDFTGFPWWLVIASSTLALRLTLFPFVVLQLHKLKKIAEVFPKLPPPLPPPFSGRSFKDQLALFQKERKAVGCPSFFWFFATFTVQVPLFLLWITTFRRMSLDHHPGFDCGGIFWFQNLTEFPNGVFGPLFPLLIAGLHYTNVQIAFQKSSTGKVSDVFEKLAKYYKTYLELLSIPILFITFNVPQGSLVFWFTNILLNTLQQLALRHTDIREKLGLPDKAAVPELDSDERAKIGVKETNQPGVHGGVSVQNLSPKDLVLLSVKFLANGNQDRAIQLLRLALKKDPEYVRALLLLGQALLQKNFLDEAIEYLECAIAKLLVAGHPTDVEDVDLLILSSTWAGSAFMRQGRNEEGMAHLERLASLEEPMDPMTKAHYYDGLLVLSSALFGAGRKAEAAEHLRRAAAYDPDRYAEFLEQCENDKDDFVSDLVSSRRTDS